MSVPGLKSGVPSSICGVPRGIRPPVNVDAGTNGAEEPSGKVAVFLTARHTKDPRRRLRILRTGVPDLRKVSL